MDAKLRQRFTCVVLPVVRRFALKAFAGDNAELREERVAEATAAAFVSFVSLVRRGREDQVTPGSLAYYAVLHVRDGRHVGGSRDRTNDALTPRNGVTVTRFGTVHDLPKVLHEALAENSRSPVPDQAAFRIDFPEFLSKQPERKQEVAILLAQGNRCKDVAQSVGISAGRVTQIRQELHKEWAAASP